MSSFTMKAPKSLIAMVILPALVLGSASAASAGPRFEQTSLTASVKGTAVTLSTTVRSGAPSKVTYLGICVRDQNAKNFDVPRQSNTYVSSAGTAFTGTKDFAPGTYSYMACAYVNGTWWGGSAKLFTVAHSAGSQAAGFTQVALAASISSAEATLSSTVTAAVPGIARELGICVRDPNGKNFDLPKSSNVNVSSSVTSFTTSGTFAPGVYTYMACAYANGTWWGGSAKAFVIAASAAVEVDQNASQNRATDGAAKPGSAGSVSIPRPATPPAASASGMPVGDLPGWKQSLAQDFLTPAPLGSVGAAYGSALRGYDGFVDTSNHGTYTPDSVLSVSGGVLDFYLHSEGGQPRVAAPVLNDYRGQTYGRYSVKFRSDPMPGYKMAFLLWPTSDNWNEGEIDWPDGTLGANLYAASAIKGSFANGTMSFDPPVHVSAPTSTATWHVATTEWTPGSVKWFWDGVLVGSTTIPSGVPTTNLRWTLQAETANNNAPAPAPNVAGHLQVDWVVQYAYSPGTK
jgi:hypothetical protein